MSRKGEGSGKASRGLHLVRGGGGDSAQGGGVRGGRSEPPDQLTAGAKSHYRRILALLEERGAVAPQCAGMVADLACSLDAVEVLSQEITALGGPTCWAETGAGGRVLVALPEVGMRSEALREASRLLTDLGLTPASWVVGSVPLR